MNDTDIVEKIDVEINEIIDDKLFQRFATYHTLFRQSAYKINYLQKIVSKCVPFSM